MNKELRRAWKGYLKLSIEGAYLLDIYEVVSQCVKEVIAIEKKFQEEKLDKGSFSMIDLSDAFERKIQYLEKRAHRLKTAGALLNHEARVLWSRAVKKVYPSAQMTWKEGECHLDNGEVYKPEPVQEKI